MKLIRAEILGFGALTNVRYEFRPGLNAFLADNGSGKTTFAAFLLAMLYGLEQTRTTDKSLKDRKRYAPWKGGKFGGTLELSSGGRVYRIERSFDAVSAARDVLEVYDVTEGCLKVSFPACPGETLLKIPKDAFIRTAFLSGKESGNVGGIIDKINGGRNTAEGTLLYSQANAILNKARKVYRSEKGKSGSIEQTRLALLEAQREMHLAKNAKASAISRSEQLDRLVSSLKEKEHRIAEYNRTFRIKTLVKARDELKNKEKEAKDKFETFLFRFGKDRIPEQTLTECEELLIRSGVYAERAQSETLEVGEKFELTRLEKALGNGCPAEEELLEARSLLIKKAETEKRLASIPVASPDRERSAAFSHFDSFSCPDNAELEEMNVLCGQYLDAKREKEERNKKIEQESAPDSPPSKQKQTIRIIASLASAGVTLAVGILFAVFGIPLSFIWFLLSFAALVCTGVLVFRLVRRRGEKAPYADGRDEAYLAARERLSARLAKYGYTGEDLSSVMKLLISDRERYLAFRASEKESEERIGACRAEIDDCQKKLDSFFSRFPFYDCENENARLLLIADDARRYREILSKRVEKLKSAENDRILAKKTALKCREILKGFGALPEDFDPEQILEEEKEKALLQKELEKTYETRKSEVEAFLREHPELATEQLTIVEDDEKEEAEKAALELRADIGVLKRKIEEDERFGSREDELRSTIEGCREELERKEYEYRILTLTRDFLESAQIRLVGRFTQPLKERFKTYADKMNVHLPGNVMISPDDLSLSVDADGQLRPVEAFNTGFSSICEVAMRLAMIDVAYTDDPPFVVLDDPFAFLDDDRLKCSLDALETFGSENQILYFTCHSKRAILS